MVYKVLMICPWALDKKAGAEIFTFNLASELARNGNIVHVLCFPNGVNSIKTRHRNLHFLPLLRKRLRLLTNFILVFKLALKERYDIVHAHFVYPAGAWALAAKILNIPIVITSHGWDIQLNRDIGYGARQSKIIAFLTRIILRLIDAHVVVSKSMIRSAIESGSSTSKVRVIYNGINLNKFPKSENDVCQHRRFLKEPGFRILYLSRLHPKKRPEDLVKAFPRVLKKVPNAMLIIAGKGGEEAKLKKIASKLGVENKIVFTGFVPEHEKWYLLRECDVFVLPSIVEAFGIAVIEAMACGKPVIATNVGPFPEIIRHEATGILVPTCSPKHLAEAIIHLALNPEKRKRMGAMARKVVEEKFNMKRIASQYLELYQELINKKNK